MIKKKSILYLIIILTLQGILIFLIANAFYNKGMKDQRGILKEGYQQAIDKC